MAHLRKSALISEKNSTHIAMYLTVKAVMLAVVLFVIWGFWSRQFEVWMTVDRSVYQAVFLSNGQVYFGKLKNAGVSYMKLDEVHYLQIQDIQPQPSEEGAAEGDQSQVKVIKLGNEVHGPQNSMTISRDQILFWENLKPDSKVTEAFNEIQAKQ